jgi:hypothetical protein
VKSNLSRLGNFRGEIGGFNFGSRLTFSVASGYPFNRVESDRLQNFFTQVFCGNFHRTGALIPGVKRFFRCVAFWLLFFAISFASEVSDLASARRAQNLLGTNLWSQVIRVENTGSNARYPKVVNALVFELAGILWFYTALEGTQSFSTCRGRLERDKSDFGPLLREIHAGFTRWTVVPGNPPLACDDQRKLPNGCFLESLANLQRRLFAGEVVRCPQLFSYYVKSRRTGHTVLTFETEVGLQVIDSFRPSCPIIFPREFGRSPKKLGTALVGCQVDKAVFIPIGDFGAALSRRCTADMKLPHSRPVFSRS